MQIKQYALLVNSIPSQLSTHKEFLCDLPSRTEFLLNVMHIILSIVSVIISKLDSQKACRFNAIPTNVLNKCALN